MRSRATTLSNDDEYYYVVRVTQMMSHSVVEASQNNNLFEILNKKHCQFFIKTSLATKPKN